MGEKEDARQELRAVIVRVLSAHPELAGEAAQHITAGVQSAIAAANEETSRVRLALVSALAILPQQRVTEKTKDWLGEMVAKAIPERGRCQSETDFLDWVA